MAGVQKRARRPRSTRGCHTCRIRHLKCDEGFPCRRCLSAGWQCDGPRSNETRGNLVFQHERPDTIKQSSNKPAGGLSPFAWLTDAQERRAFEFYIRKAGPLLSSVLDADFWGSLVPRLAEVDATVRYSMLAISRLCEHPIRSEEAGSIRIRSLDRRHVTSLRWQARALSLEKSQSSRVDTSMLILKCILLSCQEFQQNNFRNGWKLARTAFSLVSPLISSGCEHQVIFTAMPDEVVGTIISIMMRNACLLFNSWDPSSQYHVDGMRLDEIESAIFNRLCMVFASIKDVHIVNRECSMATQNKTNTRIRDLQSMLRTLQAKVATTSTNYPQQRPLKRQALYEYCSIGMRWLDLLCQLIDQSPTEEEFLQNIFDETRTLKTSARVAYPSAARTTYFDRFMVSPPAYFVTIFTKSSQMRLDALTLLKEDICHDSDADLIAIVGTTNSIDRSVGCEENTNNVYQIYYGSKDRDHLLHDTYNESTDSTTSL